MRRYSVLILFLLVLILPAVVSRFVGAGSTVSVPAGAGKLDIVTPHNQDIRNEFAAAFNRWHQITYGSPVALRFSAPGGTGDIRRLLEANYRSARDKDGKLSLPADFRPPFDLVWGGGDYFFDREIKDLLKPTALPPGVLSEAFPKPSLAGVNLYDFTPPPPPSASPVSPPAGPRWVGVCISSFGIVYNPDVYRRLNLPPPQTWTDLTRPELAGWVALANPSSSSSAAVAYSMVFQRSMADEEEAVFKTHPDLAKLKPADRFKNPVYREAVTRGWKKGMGTLLLIAANARYFTDSGTQPPGDVANGDAAAAMAIDFYGRNYEGTVGPDRATFITPQGATAINPDPVAILQGVTGQQYTLANHFIEFLLTPEAQLLWITKPGQPNGPAERALYRPPVRRNVYPDLTPGGADHWTHPTLNPFTDAGGFNQRNDFNPYFTETRTVWSASWIDARDTLKDAYAAILKVPDPARRDALIAKLADIPLTFDELETLRNDLRKVPKEKADEAKAKFRIDMANRFRTHYRALEAEAQ